MTVSYQESCLEGKVPRVINFKIDNDRIPATTKGCICRTNAAQPAIVFASLAAVSAAFNAPEMAKSYAALARSAPLLPVHDSVITKIG